MRMFLPVSAGARTCASFAWARELNALQPAGAEVLHIIQPEGRRHCLHPFVVAVRFEGPWVLRPCRHQV